MLQEEQIIRGAKDFLQKMIFMPLKPIPKIDLQEWNDMRVLMEKLQKQSQEMKHTQQELSSLKEQLSETKGIFKGKARKSLEGKIEQAEKLEKRIHTDMEQDVKQVGFFIPCLARGRRTEIYWGMGTKTFAVFEGIPQNCISGSAYEWQTEPLSGRYRGTGAGTP